MPRPALPVEPEPFQPPNGWTPGQAPVVAPARRLTYRTPASILSRNRCDLRRVLAVDAGRQAVQVLVREADRLVERVDRVDGGERHEQLVLEEAVVRRQAPDDGRLHVRTRAPVPRSVRRSPPTRTRPSRRASATASWWRATARSSMTGPSQLSRRSGSPIDELLGLLDQQPDQLVVDRPLDVDAAVRRALLAAEAEGASGRSPRPPPPGRPGRSRWPGSCRPSPRCTAAGSPSRRAGRARSPTS